MLVMDFVHPLGIIFVLQQTIHILMAGTSSFEWGHGPQFLFFLPEEKNKPSFFIAQK
jgi:hypothetical protein